MQPRYCLKGNPSALCQELASITTYAWPHSNRFDFVPRWDHPVQSQAVSKQEACGQPALWHMKCLFYFTAWSYFLFLRILTEWFYWCAAHQYILKPECNGRFALSRWTQCFVLHGHTCRKAWMTESLHLFSRSGILSGNEFNPDLKSLPGVLSVTT